MIAPGTGMIADDYFGGAGGWDVACEILGIQITGYEIMDEARRTRAAAGLKTSEIIDVREVTTEPGAVDLQIGSPPCQSFSMAGKGAGRRALEAVLEVVTSYRNGHPMAYAEAAALMGDERTALVVEPLRLALEGRPMFIAWEQVPTVLPVWEACADVLRRNGYSVVTGCLNAEQYGVPQTRKRAILIARRDGRHAHMPTPTHSLYYGRAPERLDPGVHKWVSMAEALGWGMTERPYPTIACSRTTGGPDKEKVGGSGARKLIYDEYHAGRWIDEDPNREYWWMCAAGIAGEGRPRPQDHPAPTITTKDTIALINDPALYQKHPGPGWALGSRRDAPSWIAAYGERHNRTADEPAPTITGESFRWPWIRPATTAMGDPRLDHPGHRDREGGERHHEKSIRITIEQAAVLQSFPADYPWQGSRTKQFLQVGNAIPPLLAYHILMTFFDDGPVISNTRAMVEWLEKPEQLTLFEVAP